MEKKEKDAMFGQFRREGILEINKIRTRKNLNSPELERERKQSSETSHLVMCSVCKVFIEKQYRKKHECRHMEESDHMEESVTPCFSVPAGLLKLDEDKVSDFGKEILVKFRPDDIG